MANYFNRWRNKGKLRCPHCNSTRLRKDGKPEEKGSKQRYFCRACCRHTIVPRGEKR